MQETHVNMNVREMRKSGYTWFFGGDVDNPLKGQHTEAGVAIVIHRDLSNYIWDIDPISDRIITITLGYSIPISFISAYAPTSAADTETKEKFYNTVEKNAPE